MYEYNYTDVIAFFKEIENDFPIETLLYKGINIWPIIKVDFYYQLVSHEKGVIVSDSYENENKNIKQKLGDILLAWRNLNLSRLELKQKEQLYANHKKAFPKGKKFNSIFLTASSYTKINSFGKSFNSQSDPFLITVKNKEDNFIFEFQHTTFPNTSKGNRNIDYIITKAKYQLKKQKLKKYITEILPFSKTDKNEFPENEFLAFLKKTKKNIVFDFPKIKMEIDLILCMKNEFIKLFNVIQPKYLIYPVYINHECFAATLAAKKLNIKSIEMQHGVYSLPIYIYHQNKFNINGHDLLPDFFFSWDKEQASLINKWSKKTNHHRALPYGINPINYWRVGEENNDESSLQKLQPILKKKELIHILFTISDFIDEKLVELITSTKDSSFWYIRNHPRALNQTLIKNLVTELKQRNCSNYEIETSTNCFLYTLLEKMDYHITISSSVACESIEMGIPTVVINNIGIILYKDLYEHNPFCYFSEDTRTILSYIHSKPVEKSLKKELAINYFEDFVQKHSL